MPRASARFVRQHPWGCLSNALFHQADARPSHTGASPASIAASCMALIICGLTAFAPCSALILEVTLLVQPRIHDWPAADLLAEPSAAASSSGGLPSSFAKPISATPTHANGSWSKSSSRQSSVPFAIEVVCSRSESSGSFLDGVEEAVEEGAVEVRVAHHDDRVGRRIFDLIDKRGDAHAHLLVRLRRVAPPRLTHL
eukprot:CAMPEP_0182848098 /NCGR_PEP_ID=MMETSP0006_2-20121128/28816_1 /TAXON_ID=97485 /ORGANISM="Prymnesium parvum, Strain Texoma1" /LENGTH=197 /DNA_ID=CAMNT_0024978487 /DNA_START=103 /DNA_END=693 /DNA_ORIENTATION=+